MASVNKVILIGNLGRDPEMRYTPSGAAVCTVSLATTRNWKNRDTGERQEETEWHRVVFYDRLAEVVGEYLKKGRSMYVEGRLRTRKWQDKEGKDQYTTEIVGEEMQMLGGPGQSGERNGDAHQESDESKPSAAAAKSARGKRSNAGKKQQDPSGGAGDMDDDVPF